MSNRPPAPRLAREPSKSRPLRRYNVILHRAADKALLFVVRAVRELTRFAEAEAMSRMWDAHHAGRAVLLSTHLELAELYVEQLAARGLVASLEPV